MAKRAALARTAHTRQKPRPRLVSKAHLLEQSEQQTAAKAEQRRLERTERQAGRGKPVKPTP